MAIVKYRNQSGILYAYNQTSEWDPVRKQSRSKRTLLGRVDEETGEIIKTSGNRGRKPKDTASEHTNQSKDKDYEVLYNAASSRIKELESELLVLSSENNSLNNKGSVTKRMGSMT